MKKTIIALLALAGITAAADINTGTTHLIAGYSDFDGVSSIMTQGTILDNAAYSATWSTQQETGNITLTTTGTSLKPGYNSMVGLLLDTSKLEKGSFTPLFSYYLNDNARYFGFAWDGVDSIVGTWDSDTASYSNNALSSSNATSGEDLFSFTYGKSYAVVFDTNNGATRMYIQKVGDDAIYSTSNNSLYSQTSATSFTISRKAIPAIDSLYLYNDRASTWGTSLVTEIAEAAAVPEPTTATLSLLALAGLAARRRRK